MSKAKKDRSRSKAKDTVTTAVGDATNRGASRGGRGQFERGRGRGTDRGRGGRGRGAASAHTNGTRAKENTGLSVPTEESTAWDAKAKKDEPTAQEESDKQPETLTAAATQAASTTAAAVAKVTSSVIPEGVKKSWASMFKPAPAPAPVPKKEPSPPQKYVHLSFGNNRNANSQIRQADASPPESAQPESASTEPEVGLPPAVPEVNVEPEEPGPTDPVASEEALEAAITPSKDELTEENVEQLLDVSHPAPTATQASTAASSWDPRSGANSATPASALQQPPQSTGRPPASGYVATALKATSGSVRTPSFQRRVLDQEEAVRMPGNRDVDRTASQIGALNFTSAGDEDVDGDREEPETRAQPPQHSPVAHPRASLPPVPQQPSGQEQIQSPPGLKDSTSLPPATHPIGAPGFSPAAQPGAPIMSQQGSQGAQAYHQYGRYGQAGGQEQSSFGQKPYDPFSQQAPSAQSPYDGFSGQQNPSQQQQSSQAQSAAFSSAPADFSSSYYTADQRNAYQNYYGQQYNQHHGSQTQQEGQSPQQQRAYGGYNAPQAENAAPSAQQSQSRYATAGEAQNSGHTTPNPPGQAQQSGQGSQAQQSHPAQPQGQGSQYGYGGHPYYQSPYYAAYMNQYQQGYGQAGYGGNPYGSKGGLYNQPHQGYGIPSQAPYDHAAAPAVGGFGGQSSLHGRDSTLAGGLGEYGRASAQPSQAAQPLGAGGPFGGMQDAFGRASSYQSQHYGQQAAQPGAGDDLKPFGEGKTASGPSPHLSQAARPGSAANTAPGQSALPPPSSQQGYSGYPSQQHGLHAGQSGSPYGGLGGVGAHQGAGQGHQASQYGAYGQGFGGSSYYGNSQQRGGWGSNYGH